MAEALVDLVWCIEGAGDDRLDPDDAVKALEGVATVVDRMSAAAETDHRRREFLETFPEGFGLVE